MFSKLVYWLTIKPRLYVLNKQLPGIDIWPSGSRYTCSPPPMFTDIDFLVHADVIDARLLFLGFKPSIRNEYHTTSEDWPFRSWRRGNVNLIVTPSKKFVDYFRVSTHICKKWNVRSKLARVAIFEGTRGGIDMNGYDVPYPIVQLIKSFNTDHGHTMVQLYKAQHLA
jgi:hypothetical protein